MLHVKIKKAFPHFMLDVAFTAEKGITGILGPSGCGKSLTLQCLAGLEAPDEGSIVLNDRPFFDSRQRVNVKPKDRKIGYMFQNYALFPHLTVKQNIAFGLKGKPKAEIEQKVAEMIKKIGLQNYERHYPAQLSGGQQQRVALARTLITEPDVLLLDEPFSAVDHYMKQALEQQLISFIQEHFTGIVLFVTHNIEEADRLCDRIIMYHEGKVIQEGKKEDVFARPVNVTAARMIGYENLFPVDSIERRHEGMVAFINGIELLVKDANVPPSPLFLSVHANHLLFVEDDRPNTFDYEIVQTRTRMNHFDVMIKTEHFMLQATVAKKDWDSLLASKKKLYLPPEHLFFLQG